MDWQKYNGGNPIIQGKGFWTDVPYSYYSCRTRGFISTNEQLVNAMGHAWFPDGPNAGGHIYFFEKSGALYKEAHSSKIKIGKQEIVVPDEVTDKLIFLATDFRGKYPEFAGSLDQCIKSVLQ